ncbi:hypothetical protein FACS1894133_1850 [Clostridia bacterium]|nr:hypothetical protein FACS1894133_1850 [Clostridia bacterium]
MTAVTVSEKIGELKKAADELPNTRARDMFKSVCDILSDLKEHIAYLSEELHESDSAGVSTGGGDTDNLDYVCENCGGVICVQNLTDDGVVCPKCGKCVAFD